MTDFCNRVEFAKVDKAKRLVYGVVYAPNQVDLQGDWARPETIRKFTHDFAVRMLGYSLCPGAEKEELDKFVKTGILHAPSSMQDDIRVPFAPVENLLLPAGFEYQKRLVKAGAWVAGLRVFDDSMWGGISKSLVTGNRDQLAGFVPIETHGEGRLVYGLMGEQAEISGDEKEVLCHKFLQSGTGALKVQHQTEAQGARIVQWFQARAPFQWGDRVVTSGSCAAVTKIDDDGLWARVEKGELTGYSMAGAGERVD